MKNFDLEQLLANDGWEDGCGRIHRSGLGDAIIGRGAVKALPDMIKKYGGTKPFLLADPNTWAAAGERVSGVLANAGIAFTLCLLPDENPAPNEKTVGSAVLRWDPSCDIVIGVGSGVVNDTGKQIARISGCKYLIVGTAPSMDGYASGTSSMDLDGLKASLPATAASAVIGDTEILAKAPAKMLAAGVGDMAAKYISLVEWRIAALILGEYHCGTVEAMVREALDTVVSQAEGLAARDPDAVESVMRGLVLAGIAMNYAGVSRPASGVEHYFSHVWDMRHLAFGTAAELHGIQCGTATLLALKVYEQLRRIKPDREKALAYAAAFDKQAWFDTLEAFIGEGAAPMIAAEAKDGKYDPAKHAARLEIILSKWDEILAILDTLPSYETVKAALETVGAPADPAEIGQSPEVVKLSFAASKDIRDKYVASRLAWDLGVIDEITF